MGDKHCNPEAYESHASSQHLCTPACICETLCMQHGAAVGHCVLSTRTHSHRPQQSSVKVRAPPLQATLELQNKPTPLCETGGR